MISRPCEPVLTLKSFLSIGDFASYYHIWHMQTFDMRRKVYLKGLWSENRVITHSGSLVVMDCQVHYRSTLYSILFSFICSAIIQSAGMIDKNATINFSDTHSWNSEWCPPDSCFKVSLNVSFLFYCAHLTSDWHTMFLFELSNCIYKKVKWWIIFKIKLT